MKDMIIKLKLALKRLFGIKEHKHVSLWELYSILGENSVYYIGGNDALPPPLSTKEETEIISELYS